jgi:mannose-6-phosphate isomerase-like protein (cupin superfamily)
MSETSFPVPAESWDVFGPQLRCLTHLSGGDDDFCLLEGEVAQGSFVPVHSHEDRECFLVLAGEIEAWVEGSWTVLDEGQVLDIPGGRRHAWRKSSPGTALLMIATTVRMGRFLREAGRPLAAAQLPPTPRELERFVGLARSHGYWLGTAEDNAAAGLAAG